MALGTLYFLVGFRMLNPYSRCHRDNHVVVGWNVVGLMPLSKYWLHYLVDHQLLDFLTQETSRETRQAFRLPATAGFSLARFPID